MSSDLEAVEAFFDASALCEVDVDGIHQLQSVQERPGGSVSAHWI